MNKIISLSLILCVFCTSCTKNKFITLDRRAALELSPTLNIVSTRALVDDVSIVNEKIRVQVTTSDGSTPYELPDAKFTLSNGGVSWALSDILYLSSDKATIYAYSPCPADPTTVETGSYNTLKRILDLPASADMVNQIDYLWSCQNKTISGGGADINNSNSGVQLKMNHALAQIAFVFYKENFSGAGLINSIKIKDNTGSPSIKISKAVANDLSMNISDGTISGGDLVSEISALNVGSTISITSNPGVDPVTLKDQVNGYILVAPVNIADKTQVQFTFNIDAKDYSVSLTGPGAISWLAGQQYIYTVLLSGTQMSIQSVTVTPWVPNYGGGVVIN